IKIAVLSTGITRHRPLFRQAMRPIKTMVNFIKSGSPTDINDVEGHGTTMAQVLLKACPVAEIYVAKVAQTIHEPETDHAIAKAIIWATEHCDVDIIVMPFGFKKSHETIDKAILFAHEKSKVMFAPAGHEGPDGPRAYPARSPFVIAMHIADGYGRDAGFNPSPLEHDDNFSTLGFALVPDIWGPRQVLRSGADVAVAVATGIAACLLEYALSMLPLTSSDDKQWLCSSDGIRELLRLVSTKKDGYRFIAPWLVWGEDNTANDVRDLLMAIVQRRKVLKGRST
ncbi:subtilisin-like protein, partial [Zopfia rhizophila CBS 207.26]